MTTTRPGVTADDVGTRVPVPRGFTGGADRRLVAGAVATPLYFVVAGILMLLTPGFSLGAHMLSQLALGGLGLVQMANFVIAGVLFTVAARGLAGRLSTGIGRRAIPIGVTVFGVSLAAAGIFVTDPANGFPAGADAALTWHGLLHSIAAAVAGLALLTVAVVAARRSIREHHPRAAVAAVVAALIYLALPAVGSAVGAMGVGVAVGSIIGWGWLSSYCWRARLGAATIGADAAA